MHDKCPHRNPSLANVAVADRGEEVHQPSLPVSVANFTLLSFQPWTAVTSLGFKLRMMGHYHFSVVPVS